MYRSTFKKINNEEGVLVMDFIFAFMLLFGFSVLLFSISMTLTVTEVLQYMTFSSARVYAVADKDEQTSKERALLKFKSLQASPVIAPLLKNNWFEILNEPLIGGPFPYYESNPIRDSYYGVVLGYKAKILDKNLPFLGATNQSGEDTAFTTEVNAFLGKEPSLTDCMILNRSRWTWLKEEANYIIPQINQENIKEYTIIADNGC